MIFKIMLKSLQDERNNKKLPKSENKRSDNVQFITLSDVLLFLGVRILFLIRTRHSLSLMSTLFYKIY